MNESEIRKMRRLMLIVFSRENRGNSVADTATESQKSGIGGGRMEEIGLFHLPKQCKPVVL